MNKNITIYDVAKHAGVSPATVSRVMNSPEIVDTKTTKKVKQVMEKLSYIPSAIATGMVKNCTKYIGLIIPDVTNIFFANIIRGIQDVCEKHGFDVLVVNSDDNQEKESHYLKLLYSRRVDGVIMTGAGYRVREYSKQELSLMKKMRTVFIDREINGLNFPIVEVDNFGGAYKAVKYLVNMGHKKIMYLAGIEQTRTNQERRKGYFAAIRESDLNWSRVIETDFRLETSFQRIINYYSNPNVSNDYPTAIFAANDLIAIGALKAFMKLNIKVPEDISIIGFDNIPFSDCTFPPLTTIAQPNYLMGKLAGDTLLKLINKQTTKKFFRLKTKLVERGSVIKL